MKVVVITGSRHWDNRAAIERVMIGAECLIVGDCPDQRGPRLIKQGAAIRSADAIATLIAKEWDIIAVVCEADWEKYGRAAGPRRNRVIAQEAVKARDAELDVECHAFFWDGNPSSGTADCTRALESAGFTVVKWMYR